MGGKGKMLDATKGKKDRRMGRSVTLTHVSSWKKKILLRIKGKWQGRGGKRDGKGEKG